MRVIQLLAQILYVGAFGLGLRLAIRHPSLKTAETVMLFGAAAVSVALGWLAVEGERPAPLVMHLSTALGLLVPYLLLRVVDEFAQSLWLVQRIAELGLWIPTSTRARRYDLSQHGRFDT
ncbi:MAG: hypothetical protein JOZ39_06350 [Chloroflexi bacterium]|nr:hypothetical protein [Chloroflexota bacterium]